MSEPAAPSQIDWAAVDAALGQISSVDVLELAAHIASQAQAKGPKEAYNEAGSVRFQLARMRQQYDVLRQSIVADRLEAKEQQIRALEWANARKRALAAPKPNKPEPAAQDGTTPDGSAQTDLAAGEAADAVNQEEAEDEVMAD